jgi:pimeloyl-ACP methyl ester carboxylesterase
MLLLETRAAVDVVRMAGPLMRSSLRPAPARASSLTIVVPGFGADDRYTKPLRHYLKGRGFETEGWGMGKNLAGVNIPHRLEDLSPTWDYTPMDDYRGEAAVPYLCDLFAERVRSRHRALGVPITLIGWSLGGYLAREVARDLPDEVERVITLGSPIVGGPKYTATARFFSKRGLDLDWIEEEVANRESRPIRQPITAIYSKSDAIVAWEATFDRHNENVNHVQVNAAHLGLVFNPTVWRHIVSAMQ